MPTCVLIKVIYLILLKESINISLDQRSRIFQNLNGALGEIEEGSSFLLGMQLHVDTGNKVVAEGIKCQKFLSLQNKLQ